MKNWGTPKGATFWHKQNIDGTYEEIRCDAGITPDVKEGWVRGHIPKTDASKKLMSEALKGRVMTPEWRAKMSAASKGKPKSETHKAAMSAALKRRFANAKAKGEGNV